MHFSWFHLIPALEGFPDHILTAVLCTVAICIFAVIAGQLVKNTEVAIIPDETPSLRNFFESTVEALAALTESVLGHDAELFLPLIGSLFLFILANNLMGLMPGFSAATDNLNTTLALGLFVFVAYNAIGMKAHGLSYIKHFMGPLIWLAPLMLPIELVSHLVRPMSLGLRLFGNMTGDHTVLTIFLNLVPIGVPMIFYVLGMFVCFVQAFVFSLLSMVYISMATAHDH